MLPNGSTKYIFFGGKGGVGKTTLATTAAVWFADQGYRTTIVSTDPTVSLSSVFAQPVGGEAPVPVGAVPNLCGMNINPTDAKGVFQHRLNNVMAQMTGTFGSDVVSTPCMEERSSTVFNLVLLPECLPVEEIASAIEGLQRLGISVQTLVINQCILPEVVEGNRFLAARAGLQQRYLAEIDSGPYTATECPSLC